MLPWMREQIADAWHNRKRSRSPGDRRTMQGRNNDAEKAPDGSSKGSGGREEAGTFLTAAASSETFTVNVVSLEGGVLNVDVRPNFTVGKIKNIAAKHFYGRSDGVATESASSPPGKYRLVHVAGRRQLCDDRKIGDEDVKSADELMLIEVRLAMDREDLSEDAVSGPTQETIDRATATFAMRNPPKVVPADNCPADFENGFRKILVTLVQVSAKILTNSEDGTKVYEIIREKLELRCKPPNDPRVVKNLVDMGYSEKKVLKALHLKRMNTAEALEWLIEHEDDPDDEDLELPPLDGADYLDSATPGTTLSTAGHRGTRRKSLKEACVDLFKGGQKSGERKEPNLVNAVQLLLGSFRHTKRLEFRPSQRIKESLVEMGFEERKVIEALKVTGNDQSNACEWLLGARRPSLQDLDDGLDPEGPMYKAIMSDPSIQLSLTNPKVLLAYLSILETPSIANAWRNDPEISPVLNQIFTTYHSEKHAIHVNRYEDSS